MSETPEGIWVEKGKTIAELIAELRTFENQNLEVVISLDDGLSFCPISIVGRRHDKAALMYCGSNTPQPFDKTS